MNCSMQPELDEAEGDGAWAKAKKGATNKAAITIGFFTLLFSLNCSSQDKCVDKLGD